MWAVVTRRLKFLTHVHVLLLAAANRTPDFQTPAFAATANEKFSAHSNAVRHTLFAGHTNKVIITPHKNSSLQDYNRDRKDAGVTLSLPLLVLYASY